MKLIFIFPALLRDPILQEKRQEHVLFQTYAVELLMRLSGKAKHMANDLDVSLVNIHRVRYLILFKNRFLDFYCNFQANVVAQTKIQFNDKQLLQLMHQHLISKGLIDSAAVLQREAHLGHTVTSSNQHTPAKFRYATSTTPNRVKCFVNYKASILVFIIF